MTQFKLFIAASALALMTAGSAQAQSAAKTNDAAAMKPVKAMQMMTAAVPCADVERSIAFYTKGMGMTVADRVEMPQITEVPMLFPGGGPYLMLVHPKDGAALPRSPVKRAVLQVPDLKALEAQLVAAGYKLNGPVHEQTKYHLVVGMVDDPDGNTLELVQLLP